MNLKKTLSAGIPMLALFLVAATHATRAQQHDHRIVRIAELEIDPAQLKPYKAVLKEEIEASIRLEPGVLALYAVAVKDNPTHLRLFEIYANQAAYDTHRETPHFKKYKTATQAMVKTLNLIETDPILLGSKGKP